jgi:thymidylate synthase (FAD)
MTTQIDQPPHGYVRYIDHFGSDQRIVEAARVSYLSPSKGEDADKKLLFYLYKNRHTSPFEQCNITFNIKFPIFLMRQFVRHRTFRLNEWSGRYSELADQFYTPKAWRKQDDKNKQGSVEADLPASECYALLEEAYRVSYQSYKALLYRGVAKEMARFVLPVGVYTSYVYVKMDTHNRRFKTLQMQCVK